MPSLRAKRKVHKENGIDGDTYHFFYLSLVNAHVNTALNHRLFGSCFLTGICYDAVFHLIFGEVFNTIYNEFKLFTSCIMDHNDKSNENGNDSIDNSGAGIIDCNKNIRFSNNVKEAKWNHFGWNIGFAIVWMIFVWVIYFISGITQIIFNNVAQYYFACLVGLTTICQIILQRIGRKIDTIRIYNNKNNSNINNNNNNDDNDDKLKFLRKVSFEMFVEKSILCKFCCRINAHLLI